MIVGTLFPVDQLIDESANCYVTICQSSDSGHICFYARWSVLLHTMTMYISMNSGHKWKLHDNSFAETFTEES